MANNNTITVDLNNFTTEEREQFLKLIKESQTVPNKPKKKRWKPSLWQDYWIINGHSGTVYSCSNNMRVIEETGAYIMGNCFKTREEAEFALERHKVIVELQNFADEHNDVIDWNNKSASKYTICYDYSFKEIICIYMCYTKHNDIYFSSKEIAEAAIAYIGEDRLKKYYFGVEE